MSLKNTRLNNFTVNIRLKLAILWATIMALYIYADYFNLMAPNSIEKMMALETPVGPTTPTLLIIFSILLIIPAMMMPASVFLKPGLAKWLNIIIALIYAAISILIIISDISSRWMTFFVLYNFVELFVFGLIIWQAWSWPRVSTE